MNYGILIYNYYYYFYFEKVVTFRFHLFVRKYSINLYLLKWVFVLLVFYLLYIVICNACIGLVAVFCIYEDMLNIF